MGTGRGNHIKDLQSKLDGLPTKPAGLDWVIKNDKVVL